MWFFIFFTLFFSDTVLSAKDCKVKNQNENFSNVLYNVLHWVPPILKPEVKTATIRSGQVINAECGNGFLRNEFIGNEYVFQCTEGKYNKTLTFEDLLCRSDYHKHTKAVRLSPTQIGSPIFKCDGKDLQLYQIRTVQPDGSSKVVYSVCLNAKLMRSKFVFQPGRNEAPPRKFIFEERSDVWGFDGFGISANEMLDISKGYVKKNQQSQVTGFLSPKYSASNPYPYYFNRGHLAPYADYSDENDRKATCEYINAAPQWEILNKQSWSLVEKEARNLRQTNPIDWEVYTGTYGSIQTPGGPLLLVSVFENRKLKKRALPVPMLYWKLIHNKKDKSKSKAFVGVNNPEIKSPQDIVNKYRICNPISNNNSSAIEGSEFYGFTYQCELNDFLKALKSENIIKDTYVVQ